MGRREASAAPEFAAAVPVLFRPAEETGEQAGAGR